MDYYLAEISYIHYAGKPKINKRLVQQLANSIDKLGLLNPIIITSGNRLIAGLHRLEACQSLGWVEIPAIVIDYDKLSEELVTIDENLIRKQLNALEEAELLSKRKKIYQELYPETKRGVAGALAKHNGATDKISFARSVSEVTGQSERNINRKIYVFESLQKDVIDLIKDTKIVDSFFELLNLSRLPHDSQLEIATQFASGEAKTVAQAQYNINKEYTYATSLKLDKLWKIINRLERVNKELIEEKVAQDVVDFHLLYGDNKSINSVLGAERNKLLSIIKKLQEVVDIFEKGIKKSNDSVVSVKKNKEMALEK